MHGNHESPALWGGIECTVNRVGDSYFDQLEASGHASRATDLGEFARLGVRTLRYPVLWERVCRGGVDDEDWTWSDERLALLQDLRVTPVVGLLHHGSGPRFTSLVDPRFPEKFAAYAGRVAARYPHLERFTPINEPLTTARFSGLYGHWYPHGRDDRTFVRVLLNQCRAVVLAMRAIRRVNPAASLVQTEDMGFTRSTEELEYQARFENERRFLSLDLLAGRVSAGHPLFRYLRRSGATERELDWFVENPCPPDLVGMNYYVTSERFLDGRVEEYPAPLVGGNGRHRYADVEAVRVCADGLVGPGAVLRDLWRRYRLPVAITEAHLGCTVDQQAEWLLYVWSEAGQARARGVDVRAVTVWALIGSHGWSNLLTAEPRTYESGVFTLSDPDTEGGRRLIATPLHEVVGALCRDDAALRAGPRGTGWWQMPARLLYTPHHARTRAA